MCAILDNNVVHKVFGENRPEAGETFFDWINSGKGSLVAGGKLLEELDGTTAFREWRAQAVQAGRIRLVEDKDVEDQTELLISERECKSNDQHVIALAQVSGARLLYSDDGNLHTDFKNGRLISHPRGTIYSTRNSDNLTSVHRNLLRKTGICRN